MGKIQLYVVGLPGLCIHLVFTFATAVLRKVFKNRFPVYFLFGGPVNVKVKIDFPTLAGLKGTGVARRKSGKFNTGCKDCGSGGAKVKGMLLTCYHIGTAFTIGIVPVLCFKALLSFAYALIKSALKNSVAHPFGTLLKNKLSVGTKSTFNAL